MQKFYGGFVDHLNLHVNVVNGGSFQRPTSGPRFSFVDAYTAFSVDQSSGPSDSGRVLLHDFIIPFIGGFIKWAQTAQEGIEAWVQKAHDEAYHALTVALLPARTDTRWWHMYCENRFYTLLKGRVNFSGKGSAPFPSAIVLFADVPKEALA